MTLFKKNHFWRYNLHFMDHIPILIVLFWNIGMGHNLLFPYFGGITIHWPAILVYYPGTRVLSHRCHLVGGFKHFLFSIIYGIILPIDFHMFQDGWNHQPVIHSFIRSFIHSFIHWIALFVCKKTCFWRISVVSLLVLKVMLTIFAHGFVHHFMDPLGFHVCQQAAKWG